jgi:hypothetical protein
VQEMESQGKALRALRGNCLQCKIKERYIIDSSVGLVIVNELIPAVGGRISGVVVEFIRWYKSLAEAAS